MDANELGRILRARRKAAGRTVASVATEAGLSVPYVANLENGRGNPTLAALRKLAEALGGRLDLALTPEAEPAAPPGQDFLALPRVHDVARLLSDGGDGSRAAHRVAAALAALSAAAGRELSPRDIDRFLDALILTRPTLP